MVLPLVSRPATSVVSNVAPVRFPLGLARFPTKPKSTGSPPVPKTIGMVRVAALAAKRCRCAIGCGDHRHLTASQIGSERWQAIGLPLRRAGLNRHVLALDVAAVGQAAVECCHRVAHRIERLEAQKPNHRHRRLLCPRHQRPCHRAKPRDEFPAFTGLPRRRSRAAFLGWRGRARSRF
jgi:hypothetical protein